MTEALISFLECHIPAYVGDSFCDDVTNIPVCEYDGGDCCPDQVTELTYEYCSECYCLEVEGSGYGPGGNHDGSFF